MPASRARQIDSCLCALCRGLNSLACSKHQRGALQPHEPRAKYGPLSYASAGSMRCKQLALCGKLDEAKREAELATCCLT